MAAFYVIYTNFHCDTFATYNMVEAKRKFKDYTSDSSVSGLEWVVLHEVSISTKNGYKEMIVEMLNNPKIRFGYEIMSWGLK